MATPVANTASRTRIKGSSSQLSIGRTPATKAKISTTIRLRLRLNSATRTTDKGMTRRGN